jgi:hypothetical protein
VVEPNDKECEIKLSPGTTIAGRVTDDAGAPLADARVQCTVAVSINEGAAGGKGATSIHFPIPLDDAGRCSVSAIPAGSHVTIYASSNDQGASWESDIGDAKEIAADDIVVKPEPPKQDKK